MIISLANFINNCLKWPMYLLGPIMIIGLYALLGLHIYAYIIFIVGLLLKRIGLWPSVGWATIGIVLVYNIVYNHVLATIVKPNGPSDLRSIESLREQYKRRSHRKSIVKALENEGSDDRFDGVTSDVKRLLRYRHKTMSDLSFV